MTWRTHRPFMLLPDCCLGREPMDGVGVPFTVWPTDTKHSDFGRTCLSLAGPGFLGTLHTHEPKPGKGDGGVWPSAPSLAL